MKNIKLLLTIGLLLSTILNYSQEKPEFKKIKITGKIVDKATNQPLEFATVTMVNIDNEKSISGGITDVNGEFSFDTNAATYNIKIGFITYKTQEINNMTISESTNLGIFSLAEIL